MIFSAQWPVTTDGTDPAGRISLPYLCSLLQETATMHADELGWGYQEMKKMGLFWVLSRQWIKIEKLPEWHEDITIDTWPSAKTAMTWSRDYEVKISSGETLAVASSLWFVMDREKRRPKPSAVGRDYDTSNARRVREKDLKPLKEHGHMSRLGSVIAGYHDTDIHKHVNNVRYVKWMLDGLSSEFLISNRIEEMEINFLAEGFIGDELEVSASSEAPFIHHSLIRREDASVLSRMTTRWTPAEI